VLGDTKHAPTASEVLEALSKPNRNVVANLLAVSMADRPAYFLALLPRLFELRARTGRPHWLLVDEAHHLLPRGLDSSDVALPVEPHGILLVTVHPRSVAKRVLETVGTIVTVGGAPHETLAEYATGIGVSPPVVEARPLAPGHGLVWMRAVRLGLPPFEVRLAQPHGEHHRHIRKYAAGELPPDVSFYFRGPQGKLKLRAQNLQMFMQLADGVDDDTWCHHLSVGDYSRWFRERIKDDELAREVERIEQSSECTATESRQLVRDAIERRYTAPS
jgi:hypothetical protein